MTDSQKLDYLIEQFSGVKGEITGIKEEISDIRGEISDMKGEIAGIKEEISDIRGEISDIRDEISDMRGDIRDLQERMDRQETELRYIKIVQENNFEKGIKAIAEGHVDLVRKLNGALKISEDDELIHLRVNVLEGDMARVKDKLAMA